MISHIVDRAELAAYRRHDIAAARASRRDIPYRAWSRAAARLWWVAYRAVAGVRWCLYGQRYTSFGGVRTYGTVFGQVAGRGVRRRWR